MSSSKSSKSQVGRSNQKDLQNLRGTGLAGEAFEVLASEDGDQYAKLYASLHAEYEPANEDEVRLVKSVAQHYWLMHRAMNIQTELLMRPALDHKAFSLSLRYQEMHERAYYRDMNELRRLRKQALKEKAQLNRKEASSKVTPISGPPTPAPATQKPKRGVVTPFHQTYIF